MELLPLDVYHLSALIDTGVLPNVKDSVNLKQKQAVRMRLLLVTWKMTLDVDGSRVATKWRIHTFLICQLYQSYVRLRS